MLQDIAELATMKFCIGRHRSQSCVPRFIFAKKSELEENLAGIMFRPVGLGLQQERALTDCSPVSTFLNLKARGTPREPL
jgi:hypothetical protein